MYDAALFSQLAARPIWHLVYQHFFSKRGQGPSWVRGWELALFGEGIATIKFNVRLG